MPNFRWGPFLGAVTAAVVAFSMIAGCGSSSEGMVTDAEVPASDSLKLTGPPEPKKLAVTDPAPAPDAADTGKQVETSSDLKPPQPNSKKVPEAKESYNADRPSLMGVQLTDSRTTVLQMFGDPIEQLSVVDADEQIFIFDYDAFAVGFNEKGLVLFVEVRSSEVDPGLNGLLLGHSAEAVAASLGKPDVHTTHTMVYNALGTTLKLDIEPKTETVRSIKLFAAD